MADGGSRWPFPRLALMILLAVAPLSQAQAQSNAIPAEVPYAPALASDLDAPPLPREFRGVWIATVDNIDWPSRQGLPVDSQKAELLALLDHSARLRLNAVIFQVR